MKNRIDLSNYNIHTDLVIDNDIINNYMKKTKINDTLSTTSIEIDDAVCSKLNKKKGLYITIEFTDVTNHEDKLEIEKCLISELRKLFEKNNIKENDEVLILGLGNRFSTADSLGPKTIDKILVTRHLFELNTDIKEGIRCVSGISPGVMANTGIETFDIIMGIIRKIKPKFIIAIDALASSSIDRINKTIQLTDTGIHPGSGIGNNRKEISLETVGIPVIAIGVPTVVESSIIVSDTIYYLFKHLSYIKDNYDENKLVFNHGDDYISRIMDKDLDIQEKKNLSGIIGTLSEEEKLDLTREVLNSINYNLIVTPKEIDFLIENLGEVISNGINKSLHKALNDNKKDD